MENEDAASLCDSPLGVRSTGLFVQRLWMISLTLRVVRYGRLNVEGRSVEKE